MHYHKERISCRGIKGHKNRTWTGTVGRGFSRSRGNAKRSASRRCHCQCLRTHSTLPPLPSIAPSPAISVAAATCHCFHRHCLCTTSALRMPSLPPPLRLLLLLSLISPPKPLRAINRFRFPHHHRLCCRRPCLIAATSIFKKMGRLLLQPPRPKRLPLPPLLLPHDCRCSAFSARCSR